MRKFLTGEALAAMAIGVLLGALAAFLACDSSSSTTTFIDDDNSPDDDDDDDFACGHTTVCTGCCSGNSCFSGTMNYACGIGGNACLACSSGTMCEGGLCTPLSDDDDNDNDNDNNDNDTNNETNTE